MRFVRPAGTALFAGLISVVFAGCGNDVLDPEVTGIVEAIVRDSPQGEPLLCGVDGPVMGGGGGLALAADLVWVGPKALFAFPETRLGVVPALVSVVARRRVSPLTLSGILTTGIPCDATRSILVGLADFLASDSATLEAEACALKLLQENSGAAMHRTKEFLIAQSPGDLDEELRAARSEFRSAVASPQAQRGLEAFRGKLPLTWGD